VSESAPEAPVEETEQAPEAEPETFDAEYVKKLRAEAAKHRTEARAATAELEKQRKASMTEAEKAVAEAEQRGRSSALVELGERLVRSNYIAEAARRNPEFDAASVLDDLNLRRFVGEDGEPDAKAIAASVERLVPPAGGPKFGNADQGPRGAASAPDFNAELRRAAGRA